MRDVFHYGRCGEYIYKFSGEMGKGKIYRHITLHYTIHTFNSLGECQCISSEFFFFLLCHQILAQAQAN